MKIIFKSNNLLLTILLFLSLVNPVDSRAQGAWIEQGVQPTMSGASMTKTGSDCAIHTRASSRYVYFFDIYSKAWAECDRSSHAALWPSHAERAARRRRAPARMFRRPAAAGIPPAPRRPRAPARLRRRGAASGAVTRAAAPAARSRRRGLGIAVRRNG